MGAVTFSQQSRYTAQRDTSTHKNSLPTCRCVWRGVSEPEPAQRGGMGGVPGNVEIICSASCYLPSDWEDESSQIEPEPSMADILS